MTDPIADMFTRIRNASAVKKAEIVLPLSKLKLEIAKIME
ncbi:MAG: 30S ribosomal protein S8, partial [Patescibacteria group bacterium]|nr:30S ribosomal protein S8 [Patescibacteria group bacterium]